MKRVPVSFELVPLLVLDPLAAIAFLTNHLGFLEIQRHIHGPKPSTVLCPLGTDAFIKIYTQPSATRETAGSIFLNPTNGFEKAVEGMKASGAELLMDPGRDEGNNRVAHFFAPGGFYICIIDRTASISTARLQILSELCALPTELVGN